jgi:exodeoxyribonuclease V gamma subunit
VPSVLVGQLRDYLDGGWTAADAPDRRVTEILTCRHPLQPFSEAYFRPDREEGLFTYAGEWRDVLDAPEPAADPGPLPPAAWEGLLSLDSLIRFLKNPVQAFFNQRLQVWFDETAAATEDREPFALDNLAPFGPGMALVEAGLAAEPDMRAEAVRHAARRLARTGALPSAGLGELAAERLSERALALLEHHASLAARWPHGVTPREIIQEPGLGESGPHILEDWLDGLRAADPVEPGGDPMSTSMARWEFYPLEIFDARGAMIRPHSLIGLWVRHLAGCAQGLNLTSILVAVDGCATLEPVERETARDRLLTIAAHWYAGMREPLPVAARTALAWLEARETLDDAAKALSAARLAYEGDGFRRAGERGYSPYLGRAFPDFESLWSAENNRFADLARELYAPLAAACGQADASKKQKI